MLSSLKSYLFGPFERRFRANEERTAQIQEALGRIEGRQLRDTPIADLHAAEFKVFSQWGEDGILQHLLRHIPIADNVFVEFGVEDYTEANTRFLLVNNNWSGLVIEGSGQCVAAIKNREVSWRHTLKAEHAFINRDTINDIFRRNGLAGEIGILSIDIDGNDYWVWEAINVISPTIVIVEYNARFGSERSVTIPYDANFTRSRAHYSNIYHGASLAALCRLGKRKGYALVGCNSAGSNAFFVRQDRKPDQMLELTAQQGYVPAKFREARDREGNLSLLAPGEELEILNRLPLVEIPE